MRKYLLAAVASIVTMGLAFAAEVTFVKFDKDKKALTVKEGDKEETYTITDDTKVKYGDKDGELAKAITYFSEKAKEGKSKFDITVDADKKTVKEVKFKAPKKAPPAN